MTITYRKGDRPAWQQMMKDIGKLLRKVRQKYKQAGEALKYIYRLAIGKRGGPHIHMLVNRIRDTDRIFAEAWKLGHINFKPIYEEGDYKALAEYIVKPAEDWEPPDLKRYHPSRNLIRKEPVRKVIRRRSLCERTGEPRYPAAPKGYAVDKDSVLYGRNPVTGYFYRHYTLVKLDRRI